MKKQNVDTMMRIRRIRQQIGQMDNIDLGKKTTKMVRYHEEGFSNREDRQEKSPLSNSKKPLRKPVKSPYRPYVS